MKKQPERDQKKLTLKPERIRELLATQLEVAGAMRSCADDWSVHSIEPPLASWPTGCH